MLATLGWAGPDYVRAVYRGDEVRQAGGAEAIWLRALEASGVRFANDRARRWGYGLFRGWQVGGTGVSCDVDGNVMLQVPGAGAADYMRRHGLPERITRLDIQSTVTPPMPVPDWLDEEEMFVRHRSEHWPYRGRAPRVTTVRGETVTIYSGVRGTGGVLLRIYDSGHVHGAEANAYLGTVRYELECGVDAARGVYERIGGSEWDERLVAEIVLATARRRGCAVRYVSRETQYAGVVRGTRHPDVERSMRWLERQVRPTIERLEREGVSSRDVLAALFGHASVSGAAGEGWHGTE